MVSKCILSMEDYFLIFLHGWWKLSVYHITLILKSIIGVSCNEIFQCWVSGQVGFDFIGFGFFRSSIFGFFWVVDLLTSSLQSSVVWAFLRELSSVLTGSAIRQSTTLTITKPASMSAFKSRSSCFMFSCTISYAVKNSII